MLRHKADQTYIGLNLLWILIGAILVIFMQAGFALVETGFTPGQERRPHRRRMNFAVFGLGFIGFLVTGFAFAFSGYSYPGYFGYDEPIASGALIGSGDWVFLWGKGGYFLSGIPTGMIPAVMGFFLYMVAFMDTVATIPTGSMAERWKWQPLRRLVAVLRRHLLPAVHRVDLGRRLARQARAAASTSATAMSTSPGPVSSTPWAAPPR